MTIQITTNSNDGGYTQYITITKNNKLNNNGQWVQKRTTVHNTMNYNEQWTTIAMSNNCTKLIID